MNLRETGLNTGRYRGEFVIANRTNNNHDWIKSAAGETIKVSSVQDPAKNASIQVIGPISLIPSSDNNMAQEDNPYYQHYSVVGWWTPSWTFNTNASWLSWNATTHSISGTPNNSHVGRFWIRINVTNGHGNFDEHNFTITVKNTPPKIITKNVPAATQDSLYSVNYNSSDDGQGTITWHLKTNASSWLKIDPMTGIVKGTPGNDQVGTHFVNVSVDDGNEGWGWTNFTLIVANINDPPVINISNSLIAKEDETFSYLCKAVDIDKGDSLLWQMHSNTSGWLGIDAISGLLSGIPQNKDVESYWLNISVMDAHSAKDYRNITLSVLNTNDPPFIKTKDLVTAYEDKLYLVHYEAGDVDLGDSLSWGLETNASSWLTLNNINGTLSGTPNNDQVGSYWVNISVKDKALAEDYHNFTLIVLNVNDPPEITSDPVPKATATKIYIYNITAIDLDKGDHLTYSLLVKPVGMNIDSNGKISWTPSRKQTGIVMVSIKVSDGTAFVVQTYNITVAMPLNYKPTIAPIQEQTIYIGKEFNYQIVANDTDLGDFLTYSLDHPPPGISISTTGIITWVPQKDQIGTHTIVINVSDSMDYTTAQFNITIKLNKPIPQHFNAALLEFAAIIIIVVTILMVYVGLRKRRGKAAVPTERTQEPPDMPQDPSSQYPIIEPPTQQQPLISPQ